MSDIRASIETFRDTNNLMDLKIKDLAIALKQKHEARQGREILDISFESVIVSDTPVRWKIMIGLPGVMNVGTGRPVVVVNQLVPSNDFFVCICPPDLLEHSMESFAEWSIDGIFECGENEWLYEIVDGQIHFELHGGMRIEELLNDILHTIFGYEWPVEPRLS